MRLLRLGGFTLEVTKKSAKFGLEFAAELGNACMYSSGQDSYARELSEKEPRDRATRELKTALRAFTKKRPDPELGRFAAMYVVSASRALRRTDPQVMIDNTSEIATLIESIPDSKEYAPLAEEVTAACLASIVDDFNRSVPVLRHQIPRQRQPPE